jgi:hypothetical protein
VLTRDLRLEIEDFGAIPELNTLMRKYHKLLRDYMMRLRVSVVWYTQGLGIGHWGDNVAGKRMNLNEIIKNNPRVDESALEEAFRAIGQLRASGVAPSGYNLRPAFGRRIGPADVPAVRNLPKTRHSK